MSTQSYQERQAERERLLARIEELDKVDSLAELDKLEDLTDAEKIRRFEELYGYCMRTMEELKEHGHSKDHIHYTFESAMQIALGKDVFTIYNQLVK